MKTDRHVVNLNRKTATLGFAIMLSGVALLFLGSSLLTGPFPIGSGLFVNYLMYSSLVVVFLHCFFFTWNNYLLDARGRTLRPQTTKYLEYVYAVILALGLAQVFFVPSLFADYVSYTVGNETQIARQIQSHAADHLANDCAGGNEFFTAEYCDKLKTLADTKDPVTYVRQNVLRDAAFLKHPIGKETRVVPPAGSIEVDQFSPIWKDANSMSALLEYAGYPKTSPVSRAFGWIAFMLVPIGIALRVVKTSLELFGGLR